MNSDPSSFPSRPAQPEPSPTEPQQPVRVVYPRYYVWGSAACMLLFSALVPLSQLDPGNRASAVVVWGFVGFALFGVVCLWFTLRGTLTYTDKVVRYITLMPGETYKFAWTDIRAADFNPGLQAVVLTLADGRTAWVSIHLANYQAFLAEAERRSGVQMPVVVNPDQTFGAFVEPDDEAMLAATQKARETLPGFWAAWRQRATGEGEFMLKVRIMDGAKGEQLWLADLEEKDGVVSGVIDNQPVQVRSVREGQRVSVAPESILDWAYWRDGRMVGNFSMRAMIPLLPPDQAREARALLADADDC